MARPFHLRRRTTVENVSHGCPGTTSAGRGVLWLARSRLPSRLRTGRYTGPYSRANRCIGAVRADSGVFTGVRAPCPCVSACARAQSASKYSHAVAGPYNPRPRKIDPAVVPAARKGLCSPWAVSLARSLFVSMYPGGAIGRVHCQPYSLGKPTGRGDSLLQHGAPR
jgi:hypothetical protein